MKCLLDILAICLFDPSNVYFTGEINWASSPHRFESGHYEGRWCGDRFCTGPVGRLRVGVEVALPSGWRLNYGIEHTSTISTTRDVGDEYPFVSLSWRPFR